MSSPEIDAPVIDIVEATAAITVLDLHGDFDMNTAPAIAEHISRAFGEGKHVIIDLSDVAFLDSSIVHALFTADAAAKSAGRTLVLQSGSHRGVRRVLSLTGVNGSLQTAPTRDQAVSFIEERPGVAPKSFRDNGSHDVGA